MISHAQQLKGYHMIKYALMDGSPECGGGWCQGDVSIYEDNHAKYYNE